MNILRGATAFMGGSFLHSESLAHSCSSYMRLIWLEEWYFLCTVMVAIGTSPPHAPACIAELNPIFWLSRSTIIGFHLCFGNSTLICFILIN